MSEYCHKLEHQKQTGKMLLQSNCPYCEIDRLKQELVEYHKLQEPSAVHVNILAGKLKLSRDEALHIAGATDYDQLKMKPDTQHQK